MTGSSAPYEIFWRTSHFVSWSSANSGRPRKIRYFIDRDSAGQKGYRSFSLVDFARRFSPRPIRLEFPIFDRKSGPSFATRLSQIQDLFVVHSKDTETN